MKKHLLQIVAILCVICLVLGTVGCGASPASTDGTTAPTEMVTNPSNAPSQPSEEPTQPDEEPTQPSEAPTQPSEAPTQPDEEPTQPDEEPSQPSIEPSQPSIDNALADAKSAAKTILDAYAKPEDYRDAQKAQLVTTIANGKTAIDAATNQATIDSALAAAKAAIDAIPTNEELTAEEEQTAAQALAIAKTNAKSTLDCYANPADYREAQKPLLVTAIANGKTAIDAATNQATIDAALAAAKTVIDAIPTNAELTAEEDQAAALGTAKANAKAALDNYVNADDYRDTQKMQLATAIANGKAAIDTAADIDAVDAALAAAKAAIDAIETDAQIIAKSPTIRTPFDENTVFTNNRATLDVFAKDANGNKLSMSKVTVTVNGVAATVNWDDHIKTSYNFVFEEGENTVVITATDGDYQTTVTYTVICNTEAAATITVSIEAFTVGLGYIVEPYKLTLDEATLTDMAELYGYADAAEMKEKLSAAHCLDYTLYLHGLTMDYQGALESTWNGFYMSSISGIADTSCIEVPEILQEMLDMNGYYVDPFVYDEGTLCEFDVTWGSGWMYMMNNSFPNIPFCDYIPQDGDVMRVQFTLAYGSDIGDWGFMGEPFFDEVDRDDLTECISDAIATGVDYAEAYEVVSAFGVTQDELDAAYIELKEKLS